MIMVSLTVFKNTHNRQSRSECGCINSQNWLIMDIHDWLIMNIHDSIVGIHKTVMDIRNFIFTILNYHVYIHKIFNHR